MRLAVLFALLVLAGVGVWFWQTPCLRDLGPRLVSNQTAQPLALIGDHFRSGMRVRLGAPFARELTPTVLDPHHAYVRLPAELPLIDTIDSADIDVSIGNSHATLTVVNDTAFVDLTDFAVAPGAAFAISTPTDTLYTIDLATQAVRSERVGDGPSAVQTWRDGTQSWLVIAHYYSPKLWLVPIVGNRQPRRELDAPRGAAGLVIEGDRAYVAGQVDDDVWAIDLRTGQRLWQHRVAPNPRALAVVGDALAVGSLQTGEIDLLHVSDGSPLPAIVPGPNAPIIGGHTDKFSPLVMGATAPRAMIASGNSVFVSTVGPSIGPNAARMEVSMNGSGVSVIDPARGLFQRHVSLGAGVAEGLAASDGLLFVADIGTGHVQIFDAVALAANDSTARAALVQSLAIAPPEGFPLVRPAADLAVSGRSGPELHSGPKALRVLGSTLYVLNRFSGTLAEIDTSVRGHAVVRRQIPIANTLAQSERRRGQILYHADVGHSGMTCDTCHVDGHTGGVLFTKTHPMRIYRSPTLRGTRDTPPYFVPPNRVSLVDTAQFVGDRNRYHNPDLTSTEVSALAHYNALITNVANPFVGDDGAPRTAVALPSGGEGNARAGLPVFDAHCASCHPAPLFAPDQDAATRGALYDVGTPQVFSLHPQLQDHFFKGFPPPSLLGAWDVFPMFNTGSAGLRAAADGRLEMTQGSALHEVLYTYGTDRHGGLGSLSEREKRDLFAYVLSL